MSDALEKVSGIEHIPIFPLPLVLLPNEVLPLHIFEPRYRTMLDDTEAGDQMFGVSRFDPDEATDDRPEIGSVGCVAELRDVQRMPDGRSNILTTGVVRYRIIDYVDLGKPYLTAQIEFFEDDAVEGTLLREKADEVFGLFERIAKAAFDIGGNRGEVPEIQQADPEALSFLVTAAFNLDDAVKYEFIEMTSTLDRLERLRNILVQAVDQMESSAEIIKVAKTNGHSSKKLDL